MRELGEKVKKLFYTTFYNELMNAKEKQIIFDKKDVNKRNKKIRASKRYQSPEVILFKRLNLSSDVCLDTDEVNEINERYINEVSKNIMEINEKKSLIKKFKEY